MSTLSFLSELEISRRSRATPKQKPGRAFLAASPPAQPTAQAAAEVSASQGHCPCCSATSSQGCRPTSWMPRLTCSWCPSWTVKLRMRTHLEQVELPKGSGPCGDNLPWGWENSGCHWCWGLSQGRVFQHWNGLGRAGLRHNSEVLTLLFQGLAPAPSSPCCLGTEVTPASSPWSASSAAR